MPQLQPPPEGAGVWQENPAQLVRKMKLPICLCRTNLQKSSGKQPLALAEMCVPIPPVFLKTASGCCGEMRHYKKTVWTAERQLHIQIIQQNRDLPPRSRAGMQATSNKHEHLSNDAGYC